MTTYRMKAPDGNTYKVDGPEGATDDQVREEIVRQNPHLSTPIKTGVDAIPVELGANTTPSLPDEPTSMLDRVRGVVETGAALGTGLVAAPIGQVAGTAKGLFGGNYGTRKGVAEGAKTASDVTRALSYEPRTSTGQEYAGAVGNALNNSGIMGVGLPELNALGRAAPAAIRAVKDNVRTVAASPIPFGGTVQSQQVAKAAAEQAYLARNAGMMRTAIDANKLGLVTPVENINPSFWNRFKSKALGNETNIEHSSKINTARIPALVAEEIGAPVNTAFADIAGGKKVIERALAAHDAPYVQVAALPEIVVSDEAIRAMNGLKRAPVAGDVSTVAKANAAVDDLVRSITPKTDSLTNSRTYPKSPAAILADIAELRQEGHAIMKAQTSGTVAPDISAVNTAKTKLALAKQLEQLIDDTVGATNPDLLQSLRDARVKKAQIHAWESVRNPSTGQFDVAGLAKRRLYDDMMTGTVGTVADYTNLFPKSMGVSPLEKHGRVMDHARRLSVGGAAGSLVGLALGYPGIGALTGVLVGEGAGALNAMRMMTPAVQNANAMAAAARLSNRSMVGMNPVTPNATPNGIVPYDYSQETGVPPTRPNWVPGRGDADIRTGVDTTPQLGAPSAESTLRGVKQRREFDYKMDEALDIMRAQSRETLPQRQGTGVQFDLDPVTGKLVPPKVDPVRIIGSEPEFADWRSSMSDVVQVVPEMNNLTGSQIAAKMMDRQWIQDTIKKLQDKERAFADIRAREPALARARDRARKPLTDGESGPAPLRGESPSSETMARTLDFLQEQLSKTPADKSRVIQGKVTRAAQRERTNNLPTITKQVNNLRNRP